MLSFIPPRRTIIQLFFVFLSTYLVYCLTKFYLTKRRHNRVALSLGCKPAKRWRTFDPIFGVDFIYEQYKALKAGNVMDMMVGRFAKLGCQTARFEVMGMSAIGTMEPANLQTALATDFSAWKLPDERRHHLGEFLGEGIFTTDGEAWKHSREIIRPSFARKRIENVKGNLEKHCQRLIDCIRPGEEVDFQPLFFAFTMDVATEFLFGESTDSLLRTGRRMKGETVDTKAPEEGKANADTGGVTVEAFVEAFSYAQAAAEGAGDEDQKQWLGFFSMFLPNRKLKRCYKTINCYVDAIVSRALAAPPPLPDAPPTFLTTLISHTRSPTKLRAELLNTLLAARDTTGSLLSNVWFELSHRPEIQRRLRHDIVSILSSSPSPSQTPPTNPLPTTPLPTNPPTYAHLKSLPYLTALFKESLRLYPVVPANSRQAAKDTTLPLGGGDDEKSPVFVPKGTLLHWMLWGMQRRTDLFGDDAREFRVERWLDEYEEGHGGDKDGGDERGQDKYGEHNHSEDEHDNDAPTRAEKSGGARRIKKKGLRVGWEFLPFNGGPRICVGQQFALAEAGYLIVRLLQRFGTAEGVGEGVWREKIGLTMTGKGGAVCVVGE